MYDAVVIGGGPAGCSAVLTLRRQFPRLRVLLLEAGGYSQSRPGEVLPGAAAPVLRRVGVWEPFRSADFPPSPATAFRWGRQPHAENHNIYSPWGAGWHLDRRRFDKLLADAAAKQGVELRSKTHIADAIREGPKWVLRLSSGTQVQARFVLDAAGRDAAFARSQGARIDAVDQLTGFVRYCSGNGDGSTGAETLVESARQGWWYSARVPEGRVVAFMTDSDIGRQIAVTTKDQWSELLAESDWIRTHTGGLVDAEPRARQAVSAQLQPVAGDGWLAVGDAASSVDPLAACGILRALRGGIMAAYAAGQFLVEGNNAGIHRYAALQSAEFEAYLRSRRRFYSAERRWPSQPFWRRRQGHNGRSN